MRHTGDMSNVWFGQGVADDGEFRLCGDVQGKRVIELGTPRGPVDPRATPNAVTLALAGAKVIAIDPSSESISSLRATAEAAEIRIECHQGELADLGFVTSASIDLVLAVHTLEHVDDLPRLLRQVHRVLRPELPFVFALTHPVAAMFDPGVATPARRYGTGASRSISDLFMQVERSNFHIDVLHELPLLAHRDALAPAVLLVRARKLGV
jgi:SAM-dependent methyltransferase